MTIVIDIHANWHFFRLEMEKAANWFGENNLI